MRQESANSRNGKSPNTIFNSPHLDNINAHSIILPSIKQTKYHEDYQNTHQQTRNQCNLHRKQHKQKNQPEPLDKILEAQQKYTHMQQKQALSTNQLILNQKILIQQIGTLVKILKSEKQGAADTKDKDKSPSLLLKKKRLSTHSYIDQTYTKTKSQPKNIKTKVSYKEIPYAMKMQENLFFDDQNNIKSVELTLSRWIAKLFNELSFSSFYGYEQGQLLSYEQSKSYFSRNLILNFLKMQVHIKSNYFKFWNDKCRWIVNFFNQQSRKAISFLKLKYPQKKKDYINHKIYQFIEMKQMIHEHKHFILEQFGFKKQVFTWKKIKLFINKIIEQTNVRMHSFTETLQDVFKIKDYYSIQHKIGSKVLLNTPIYTSEQLQEEGMKIKTPQILRIVIKWIQSLQNVLKKMIESAQFQNQQKKTILRRMKQQNIIKNMIKFQQQSLASLSISVSDSIPKIRKFFSFIPDDDVDCSVFTSMVYESIEAFSCEYLHFLLNSIHSIDPSEIVFQVFDLFRAKCSGNVSEIKQVYQKLVNNTPRFQIIRVKNRLGTQNRDFLFNIKYKDTFEQKQIWKAQKLRQSIGQNISEQNFGELPGFMFELQMCISPQNPSLKQEKYNHFNHFLYELERSKYGPLYQSISIMQCLQNYVSYFSVQKINNALRNQHSFREIQNVQINKVSNQKVISTQVYQIHIQNNQVIKQDCNFICQNCSEYYKMHSSFLPICKDENEGRTCSKCVFNSLTNQSKTKYLLRNCSVNGFTLVSSQQLKQQYRNIPYFIQIKNRSIKEVNIFKLFYDKQHNPYYVATSSQILNKKPNAFKIINPFLHNFKHSFILKLDNLQSIQVVNQRKIDSYLKQYQILSAQSLKQKRNLTIFKLSNRSLPNRNGLKQQKKKVQFLLNNVFDSVESSSFCEQSNQKNIYVFLKNSHSSTRFLVEITSQQIQASIQLQISKMSIFNQINEYQNKKKFRWNICGKYDENILDYIATKSVGCVQYLECNLEDMSRTKPITMQNLVTCSIQCVKENCEVDLNDFKTPDLKQLDLKLNNATVTNMDNNSLRTLLKLTISPSFYNNYSTRILDFQRSNFKNLLELNLTAVQQINGFSSNIQNNLDLTSSMTNLKKLYLCHYNQRKLSLSSSFPNLEKITIDSCNLVQIEFGDLPKLHILQVSNTNIQQLNLLKVSAQLEELLLIGNYELEQVIFRSASQTCNIWKMVIVLNAYSSKLIKQQFFNCNSFKSLSKVLCFPQFNDIRQVCALLRLVNRHQSVQILQGQKLQQILMQERKLREIDREWCLSMMERKYVKEVYKCKEVLAKRLIDTMRLKEVQKWVFLDRYESQRQQMQSQISEQKEMLRMMQQELCHKSRDLMSNSSIQRMYQQVD